MLRGGKRIYRRCRFKENPENLNEAIQEVPSVILRKKQEILAMGKAKPLPLLFHN